MMGYIISPAGAPAKHGIYLYNPFQNRNTNDVRFLRVYCIAQEHYYLSNKSVADKSYSSMRPSAGRNNVISPPDRTGRAKT
jgi:hypothetical protein